METPQPKVWLTTDTHFSHAKMIEKGFRPPDFEQRIVSQWNERIAPEDTVIHLGDVIVGEDRNLSSVLSILHGRKILVRGNHDKKSCNWYMQRGFLFACDGFQHGKVWFTHKPAVFLPPDCLINVHGHLHSDGHRNNEHELFDWHLLLSLEATDYRPVLMHEYVYPALAKLEVCH